MSAYPVVSMVLARLRRTGRLRVPCCALVTDFDPHPAWVHPELDDNFGVGRACVAGMRAVRPPVPMLPIDPTVRPWMRRRLGIAPDERVALIVGGAWGVGNLQGAARAVAAVPGLRPVVVAGHNSGLQRRLGHDEQLRDAVVFGFTDLMPALMVGVRRPGCERRRADVPRGVRRQAARGHVRAAARARRGQQPAHGARRASSPGRRAPATSAASSPRRHSGSARGPATAAAARALFDRPCTADCLYDLRPVTGPNRALVRARRVLAVAAAVAALGMTDRVADAVAGSHVHSGRPPVVRTWDDR